MTTKTDFDAKLSGLNKKITQNKTKHLLVENGLNKLKSFDSSYFIGKCHFEEDGTQNCLVFQPIGRYFKIGNSGYVLSWKSKGLSGESITPPSAPNNFLSPSLNYLGHKIRVKCSGSCLKQDKITYTQLKIVNIYIVYEINKKDNAIISDLTLENCLFGQLLCLKTSILISMGILVMELDLIEEEVFHFQVVDLVKMYEFLEFMGLGMIFLHTLIIRKKTY